MAGPLVATFLISASLGQCPSYSAERIGGVPCGVLGPTGAGASGLNEAGVTCGNSETGNLDDFAFTWQVGAPFVMIPFAVPVSQSRASDLNSKGVVIGEVDGAMGQSGIRGFVWNGLESIFLSPLDGDQISNAYAINDRNIIVGFSSGTILQRAVFWRNRSAVALQLPQGPHSFAEDINDLDQICGWMGIDPYPSFGATPFIWHKGKTTALPLPPYAAANSGTATALNNLGDACGYFFIDDPDGDGYLRRACAWIDGEFIELGLLPGAEISHPLDINDAREIVGYCAAGPSQGVVGGFIWRDGVMTNLMDLLPQGIVLTADGVALNNVGQIAGGGTNLDHDGIAIRLTPALPAISGNTNCDQVVDVDDLINVILAWNPQGPVGGRPADVNRDNRIDVEDLIEVIRGWSRTGSVR